MKITEIVDQHMNREAPLPYYRDSSNMYPSQASVKYFNDAYQEEEVQGACMRQIYYRVTGVIPEPFTVRTKYIFEMGNIIEDMFTSKLKEIGLWIGNSIKFYDNEIGLSGEIDILVRGDKGKPIIIEMKSTSGYYSWKEIAGNMSTVGKPKAAHLLQILLYLYNFRDTVDEGVLLYFNRDNVERKEFEVSLQVEGGKHWPVLDGKVYKAFSVEDIRSRYEEARDFIDGEVVPPKDYIDVYTPEQVELNYARGKIAKTKYQKYQQNSEKNPIGDWNCSYCAYKHQCDKDD